MLSQYCQNENIYLNVAAAQLLTEENTKKMKKILIIFGSQTDEKVYKDIARRLKELNADYDMRISSAHKTPKDVDKTLENDYGVIIAGAGLAAHLPGVCAAKVLKPVIGVPCEGNYHGLDALLSIAQMPPGIPVLAVGVNQARIAAENASKMLKRYENVTIIGDQNEAALQKAVATLKKFNILHKFSEKHNPNSINLEFAYFNEPVEKKNELVIYCPLISPKDDTPLAALNFLKHTSHGLWVGLNNGVNAAIAAVEIMNVDNTYEELLLQYRRDMGNKVLEANKGMKND